MPLAFLGNKHGEKTNAYTNYKCEKPQEEINHLCTIETSNSTHYQTRKYTPSIVNMIQLSNNKLLFQTFTIFIEIVMLYNHF